MYTEIQIYAGIMLTLQEKVSRNDILEKELTDLRAELNLYKY